MSTTDSIRKDHNREKARQRPSILRNLVIRHEDSARLVRQNLIQTLASLYRIEIVIPKLPGARREIVEVTREQVIGKIEEVATELASDISQFKEVINQNGLGDLPPLHYNREPYRFEVEISSPLGNRYINLIEMLDEAIGQIEMLFLMEVFDWYQHIDGPRRMSKMIYGAASGITTIQRVVEKQLRERSAGTKAATGHEAKPAQNTEGTESAESAEAATQETSTESTAEASAESPENADGSAEATPEEEQKTAGKKKWTRTKKATKPKKAVKPVKGKEEEGAETATSEPERITAAQIKQAAGVEEEESEAVE